MRALLPIALPALVLLLGACTFPRPLDEVAARRSPAEQIETRERRERAETDRIVRCQSMDREDPRWDRDCKNR